MMKVIFLCCCVSINETTFSARNEVDKEYRSGTIKKVNNLIVKFKKVNTLKVKSMTFGVIFLLLN